VVAGAGIGLAVATVAGGSALAWIFSSGGALVAATGASGLRETVATPLTFCPAAASSLAGWLVGAGLPEAGCTAGAERAGLAATSADFASG
jgi:hypothetical protein